MAQPGGAGNRLSSVVRTSSPPRAAAKRVPPHAAHFTRTGNRRTPCQRRQRTEIVDGRDGDGPTIRQAREQRVASATVFPFTLSVMSDADAAAQPLTLTSRTSPLSTWSYNMSDRCRIGLSPSAFRQASACARPRSTRDGVVVGQSEHADVFAVALEQAIKIVAMLPEAGAPYAYSPVPGVRLMRPMARLRELDPGRGPGAHRTRSVLVKPTPHPTGMTKGSTPRSQCTPS